MLTRRFVGLISLIALLLLLAGTLGAFAAANTVPASRADDLTLAITANALKPAACAGLNLANIVVGSGTFSGSGQPDLVLGSAGADVIDGRQGDDCILGGAGNDSLAGFIGNDVLLGGADNDFLSGQQHTDVCDGGLGADSDDGTCESRLNIP